MQHKFTTAKDLSNAVLERLGHAFTSEDFDLFKSCVVLPLTVETFDGTRVIDSDTALQALYCAIQLHHRNTGVTDMVCHCIESEFKDPNTVVSTFETRLLNGTTMTQNPFPVFSVLTRSGGNWKLSSMTYAICDRPDHNFLLLSAGT